MSQIADYENARGVTVLRVDWDYYSVIMVKVVSGVAYKVN